MCNAATCANTEDTLAIFYMQFLCNKVNISFNQSFVYQLACLGKKVEAVCPYVNKLLTAAGAKQLCNMEGVVICSLFWVPENNGREVVKGCCFFN